MRKITLREITRLNFKQCIKLEVADNQKAFVASNMESLAEAKANDKLFPYAIYGEEAIGTETRLEHQMLGFIMYQVWDGVGFIKRLMVDKQYQKQGYGTAAMKEVVRRLKMIPEITIIATSIHKKNPTVIKMYNDLGFTRFVKETDVEVYYQLDWDPSYD